MSVKKKLKATYNLLCFRAIKSNNGQWRILKCYLLV